MTTIAIISKMANLPNLPRDMVRDICKFSDLDAVVEKNIRSHFRKNVLTKIDPTIVFTGNKFCEQCSGQCLQNMFLRRWQYSIERPLCNRCFSQREHFMVSAHSAVIQEESSEPGSMMNIGRLNVLEKEGFLVWKKKMMQEPERVPRTYTCNVYHEDGTCESHVMVW